MNREQKEQAVAEIADEIKESQAVFAVDYRGITVAQVAAVPFYQLLSRRTSNPRRESTTAVLAAEPPRRVMMRSVTASPPGAG